ncbi:hypothetical protein DAPPUDRAFT_246355 [Daphnia pulex]|uniref:Uncharacterized protein n=1 Tax=Daphnia pulex TaxID=6669 RepID=E9GQ99_DAPPU|nr:hypothetical protein DAPPUDRAFT_246355 [Daphnia pulex]|eukprot:EFX78378.1 hypothetical protein DAPPUDRAFT_246355 [Daphnia pulex]
MNSIAALAGSIPMESSFDSIEAWLVPTFQHFLPSFSFLVAFGRPGRNHSTLLKSEQTIQGDIATI